MGNSAVCLTVVCPDVDWRIDPTKADDDDDSDFIEMAPTPHTTRSEGGQLR